MQTLCEECGHGNMLGRLFCTECGTKLNLENIGEEIEQNQEAERRRSALRFIWIPVVLAVIAVIGLCAWPYKSSIGEPSSRAGRGVIDAVVWRLSQVIKRPAGESVKLPRPIKEADINAWLQNMCAPLHPRSMSIDLKEAKFRFRVVDTLGPYPLIDGRVNIPMIPYSYDVVVENKDGRPHITMGWLGHFPMVGPLKKIPAKKVAKWFESREREKKIVDRISDMEIEEGQISITVTATG